MRHHREKTQVIGRHRDFRSVPVPVPASVAFPGFVCQLICNIFPCVSHPLEGVKLFRLIVIKMLTDDRDTFDPGQFLCRQTRRERISDLLLCLFSRGRRLLCRSALHAADNHENGQCEQGCSSRYERDGKSALFCRERVDNAVRHEICVSPAHRYDIPRIDRVLDVIRDRRLVQLQREHLIPALPDRGEQGVCQCLVLIEVFGKSCQKDLVPFGATLGDFDPLLPERVENGGKHSFICLSK